MCHLVCTLMVGLRSPACNGSRRHCTGSPLVSHETFAAISNARAIPGLYAILLCLAA
jgi:hypothetical protein